MNPNLSQLALLWNVQEVRNSEIMRHGTKEMIRIRGGPGGGQMVNNMEAIVAGDPAAKNVFNYFLTGSSMLFDDLDKICAL